ncbi:MAG: DUF4252 domain-containing protein [Bacteroidia bacterium]|nr:DUF4252 domain-containing protein [Bacteroidia bacterium]
MKKYFILFMVFFVTAGLSAQNKAIEQLFQKYSDKDGFTSVVITKNMFQLFANVDNPTNDDFLKTVKSLDFIKILSIKGEKEGAAFYQEIQSAIPEKDYKELMTIKETGNQVKFLTLEKDGVIKELIMISGGKEESTMIWIAGIIDMKTVSKIAQGMQIDGMENLEKVKKIP